MKIRILLDFRLNIFVTSLKFSPFPVAKEVKNYLALQHPYLDENCWRG